MTFQLGDVVRLKSGGPPMTIGAIDDRGGILCEWFKDAELKSSYFASHSLELVKQPAQRET